jgi:hypothetical protein
MAEGDEHNECSRDDFQNNRYWRNAVYEYEEPDDSENDEWNQSSPSSCGADTDLFWRFFISHRSHLLLSREDLISPTFKICCNTLAL